MNVNLDMVWASMQIRNVDEDMDVDRTPEYTNISLTHERTKMGPKGAQGLGQKEREGPAGPEKYRSFLE